MQTIEQQVHVAIIEDEKHNRRMLEAMVKSLRPSWNLVASLESVDESIDWLANNNMPDLILMDIQLSDGNCFTILNEIPLEIKTKIIFTTAYDEYAVKAFKHNSIDYLLKPIEEQELENAFGKFERFKNEKDSNKTNYHELLSGIINNEQKYRTRFLISGINHFHKLDTKDIAYIYSENKTTFAVDNNNNQHVLEYTLEQIEKELSPQSFFRANRKIIVNINAVDLVSNEQAGKLNLTVKPKATFEISISRLKANEFKQWMGK
jgi:DNA-binding LytR/AlgR family response regulator